MIQIKIVGMLTLHWMSLKHYGTINNAQDHAFLPVRVVLSLCDIFHLRCLFVGEPVCVSIHHLYIKFIKFHVISSITIN